MATPSDLIAHYSSKALTTRLAALTFVGAVIGATWTKLSDEVISTTVGFVLIFLVASLGELNRRYTHSYLSACLAASSGFSYESADAIAAAQRWKIFRKKNESPWQGAASRFVLLWLTYFPGLILGVFLVGRGCWHHPWQCLSIWIAVGLTILIITLWIVASIWSRRQLTQTSK